MAGYPAVMRIATESPITFEFYRGSGNSRVDYIPPLSIGTGLDQISWSYNLNTVTRQTLGGEVTQILGCYIGPMTISGTSSTPKQLQGIYYWFRDYMTLAGLQPEGGRSTRIQTPVKVTYAARSWVFWFKPTELPSFQYDTESIATPWTVTGEIAGWTGHYQMGVDDPLTVETWQYVDGTQNLGKALADNTITFQTFANIGFDAQSAYIDPTNPLNQDDGINNFGDNFQRLIASLNTGQFNPAASSFDPTADPSKQFTETADELYKTYFGSTYVAGGTDNSSSGSATPVANVSASSSEGQIAQAISAAFEAAQIPGQLGVTVALIETSNLDPNAYEGSGVSGEGIGLFQDSDQGAESRTPEWIAAHKSVTGKPHGSYASITANYPAADQISNAVKRFKAGQPSGITYNDSSDVDKMARWAFAVQVGEGYTTNDSTSGNATSEFQSKWAQAKQLLADASTSGTATTTISSINATGSDLVSLVLNHKNFLGTDGTAGGCDPLGDIKNYSTRGINAIVLQGMVAVMDLGISVHVSCLRTGHTAGYPASNPHVRGLAVDINNYGPGGAASGDGGTSSTDPSSVISTIKQNRSALGNVRIGYGSPSDGADFADTFTHLHLDWVAS